MNQEEKTAAASRPYLPTVGSIIQLRSSEEPVEVVTVNPVGEGAHLVLRGVHSGKLHDKLLTADDLRELEENTAAPAKGAASAERFFLGMEAHRIRFAYQFDPLYAVNVSQVDPLPHQIEAVYHYILRNPRIRFLLADDPGAGKTIMTGLLLKELKYRGLVQRVLIVVPSQLRDQWLREMHERFHESFDIVSRETMNESWGRNIWLEKHQVITSLDFAKQPEIMLTLDAAEWDLVVVDEAHKMAAYRYGHKIDKTGRYRLGELLSQKSRFMLFLTATPHRGDPENFHLFLQLLEPGLFADAQQVVEAVRNRENPIFLRRLKEDLRKFDGTPLFPPRYVHTPLFTLSDDESELYEAVTDYVRNFYDKALKAEKRNVAFAMLILQRRLASSVRAIRSSLENRKTRLTELLQQAETYSSARDAEEFDEELFDDLEENERLKKEQELLERLTTAESREELRQEIGMLEELIGLARKTERSGTETKLSELQKVLEETRIRETGEKLLIFTESRETLQYLVDKIQQWGLSVVALHGGMNLDERLRAEHRFRHQAQVMVSTEAGGEGINLQFCSLMVNYDLPWNPNRLEQRMGRIHRYGQQKEVHIFNLVAANTIEGEILRALFEKLERIREAYGKDRVFDIIGDLIEESTLKDLIVDALLKRRSLEEIRRELCVEPDQEFIERIRDLVSEGLATKHLDLSRILGEERRARESRLTPEYVQAFFERACRLLNLNVRRSREGLWQLADKLSRHSPLRSNLPSDFRYRFGELHEEYRRFSFDKDEATRTSAEYVAPGHPLLEAVIENILALSAPDLMRGATFEDPEGRLDGWISFFEITIRDATEAIAGRRIAALYWSGKEDERPTPVPAAILWDLKGCDEPAPHGAPPSTTNQFLDVLLTDVITPYREELLQQRQRDAKIKRRYGLEPLRESIAELESKLVSIALSASEATTTRVGEKEKLEKEKEDLLSRCRNLETTIERETKLLADRPRPLGLVRIRPMKSQASQEMRSDPEIEAIAMECALAYERMAGRTPEDVSAEKLGYDIRSTSPDGSVRYIEVKGRATSGALVLTPNEWTMARRLGSEYWLYVVTACTSNAPQIHVIQDPATKLQPREEHEIVRYIVDDWHKAAVNDEC